MKNKEYQVKALTYDYHTRVSMMYPVSNQSTESEMDSKKISVQGLPKDKIGMLFAFCVHIQLKHWEEK